jgi:hypothetical protein
MATKQRTAGELLAKSHLQQQPRLPRQQAWPKAPNNCTMLPCVGATSLLSVLPCAAAVGR